MCRNDQDGKTERRLVRVVHDELLDLSWYGAGWSRFKDCHDQAIDSIVLIDQGVGVKIGELRKRCSGRGAQRDSVRLKVEWP
jgi:hypothetical protein